MTTQPTEYSPSWPGCTGVWKRKTLGFILLVALTLAENALAHCRLTLSGPSGVCVGEQATYTASVSGCGSCCSSCTYTWTNAIASGPGQATNTWTTCGTKTVSVSVSCPCCTQWFPPGSSASTNTTVVKVASLTPDLPSDQGGLESGSDPPTYWVCPCASGDVIVTASSCPILTADQLPACWTFTGGDTIDKLHHKVSKAALLNGPVTFTVSAGTSTKTIILKADEPKAYYDMDIPDAICPEWYGSYEDANPLFDKCGNHLEINCESPGLLRQREIIT